MKLLVVIAIVFVLGAAFFLLATPRVIVIRTAPENGAHEPEKIAALPALPEASAPTSSEKNPELAQNNRNGDIPDQKSLQNPPDVVRAIYLTGWSVGSESGVARALNLMRREKLNAAVIDIKDYSGFVSYKTNAPEVSASGAERKPKILRPNAVLKLFHDNGIYVIGRITVFQDPVLAKAHPEWALKNKTTKKVWIDQHGLSWIDPAAQPAWDYTVAIARDALRRGFDEVNFDYVRFASDGNLGAIEFPFWDGKMSRHAIIKKFFAHLRERLPDAKISADLFGLSTFAGDDLGIGQVIEDAYRYFDYVSPMVYPSHYAPGTLGYKNPAAHPYEIIKHSMDNALKRLMTYDQKLAASTSSESSVIGRRSSAKLRPWLQAFDLGAVYNEEMIDKELRAVGDVFSRNVSDASGSTSAGSPSDYYGGWLLWDPANNYSHYRASQ